jgi:hypothetical protein
MQVAQGQDPTAHERNMLNVHNRETERALQFLLERSVDVSATAGRAPGHRHAATQSSLGSSSHHCCCGCLAHHTLAQPASRRWSYRPLPQASNTAQQDCEDERARLVAALQEWKEMRAQLDTVVSHWVEY